MAIFLVYEGDPADPFAQYVRAVEARNILEAGAPGSIMVQRYEEPRLSEPPDLEKMKRGPVAVWSI